ncbi:Glioma tumor suppressor candidate region protein 2 [Nowakowskiella sp. JEL0407]|nr:Glioma tumor suppressor candidate region protein 2 [Nowakowskiella sp. JEL0407]
MYIDSNINNDSKGVCVGAHIKSFQTRSVIQFKQFQQLSRNSIQKYQWASTSPEDDVDGDEDDEQEVEPTQEENLGQDGLLHINEPVNPDKRKTTAQRNREAKIKKQLAMEEKQREQKKLRKELNRIAELKKEIEKDPKKSETEEKKDDGDVLPPPKRLGPHVFKKPAMTIQLTDELSDSLRRLKPEGSIIKDRFTSLQERAMIEPRVPEETEIQQKNGRVTRLQTI